MTSALSRFFSSFSGKSEGATHEVGAGHMRKAVIVGLLLAQAATIASPFAPTAQASEAHAQGLHTMDYGAQHVDFSTESRPTMLIDNPLIEGGVVILKGSHDSVDRAFVEDKLGHDYVSSSSYECIYTPDGSLIDSD